MLPDIGGNVGIALGNSVQAFDDLLVYNSGDVSATTVNNEGYGSAFGIVARNSYGDVDLINVGDITVASGGQAAGITASTYGGYFYFYYSGFGSYFNGDVIVGNAIRRQWGLHLIDMHLVMGNLISIASAQSAAWLQQHAARGLLPADLQ